MTERETRIDDMNESKTRFISGVNPFLPEDRDITVPVTRCNGLCHVTRTLSRHNQSVVACNRRPRVETAASLTAACPPGTTSSPEHRGRQVIRLTTCSEACSDEPLLLMMCVITPCLDFATTCYDTLHTPPP
jgi:hypothetical protein